MTTAVAVEDLFAIQRGLDRAAGEHGELGRGRLVLEQLELAAEAASNRRSDHPHLVFAQSKRFGQLLVDVMGRLRARPQREFSGRIPLRHTRMLLEGEMRVALEEVRVLEDVVGVAQRGVDVAEFERGCTVGIAKPALVNRLARLF
jgi:hypothetical protein